jgi:hypothetical protein
MTYPGLQELHCALKHLVRSGNAPVISFETAGVTQSEKWARIQLVTASFARVAFVVETLASGKVAQYQLSPEARLTLRTAVSTARQYVALILPLFYDPDTLAHICATPNDMDLAYSDHGDALLRTSDYPHFRRLWLEIRTEKRRFRHITKNVRSNKPWLKAVIHRLNETSNGDSIRGRRVILDPRKPHEYSDKTKFYQMFSESSHVIGGPESDIIELHLLVSATECDLSDLEIREILTDRTGKSFLDQKWFLGAHVVNLHRLTPVATWMDLVDDDMLSTLSTCRLVKRSEEREAAVVRDDGAAMLELSFHCDQQGYLRAPHNFDLRLDESSKFDLMQAHDIIMDGVVLVTPPVLDSSYNAHVRSPRPCSQGCGDTGRSKGLRITLFPPVIPP